MCTERCENFVQDVTKITLGASQACLGVYRISAYLKLVRHMRDKPNKLHEFARLKVREQRNHQAWYILCDGRASGVDYATKRETSL